MPSPFPGMDPYLESPEWWRGFHNRLIGAMEGALNASLPAGFGANAEERVYLSSPQDAAYPDVLVKAHRDSPPARTSGGVAVLEAPAASETHGVLVAYPETITEPFIAIRAARNLERVITVIEVLSPSNKTPGGAGRTDYLGKQEELLQSDTSLMEIDLLRAGAHTIAAPFDRLRSRGQWDHVVCLHRPWKRYHFEYWFNRLREPLPEVTVPLLEGMPETRLDLQSAFQQAYSLGPYARLLDYNDDPPVALTESDAAWAKDLVTVHRAMQL